MEKQKSTKRALLLSALSLLMCVSMLIGSTFAWFTDSVTSAGNKIQAGNLQVDLELYDKATDKWNSVKENNDPIFTYTNWEPGYVDAKLLKVENEGTLALKWKAKITTQASLGILADVIDVFVKPGVTEAEFEALSRADLSGWTNAGTVREFVEGIETSTYGTLNPKGTTGDSATLGIALKMREEAGNEYKNEVIGTFDIMILATQLTAEEDSFNDQYDKEAPFPQGKPSTLSDTVDEITTVVKVPDEAPEGNYTLDIPAITYENKAGATTMSLDIDLKRNGEPVNNDGVPYTVTINLPHPFISMDNFKVYHGEGLVENAQYNEEDHTITFTTTGFSPFSIEYTDYTDSSFELDYETVDVATDKYTIRKGIFVNKNPADYDETLKAPNSEYIAVDYVKDGVKYYVVSKRATSIIVGDADDGSVYDKYDATTGLYSFENGQYPVSIISNNTLCTSAVSTLNDYDHGTLYILPGTYKEQRRLDVYGSMDIIGLGNPEEIRLIKQGTTSTGSSHRHLINVSGGSGKAITDHIQVTIHNLYLDATISNGSNGNKDNGAVQSIRRSKVKCYDLIIDDNSTAAFYVNGKNKVNDQLFPAYMYVENCIVNVPRAFAIVDNRGAGDAYFYYNSLFYANGTEVYTTTNSLIKHQAMAADDWWN